MKIERNGTAIELTHAEIEAAYKEHCFERMKADVKMCIERHGAHVCSDVADIASEAIRDLGKVDAFWDMLRQSVNRTVLRHIDRADEIRCEADLDAADDVVAGNTLVLDNYTQEMFADGYSKEEVQYYVDCYHKKRNALL